MILCSPCTYFQRPTRPDRQIGTLNRKYGYKGYDPLPVGTPVFEDKRGYYFLMTLTNTPHIHRQYFYKDGGILEHIDKI